MGSDYAMNPPKQVYRHEVYYSVPDDQRARERVQELMDEGKEFKVQKIKLGFSIHIGTGRWV